MKQKTLNNHVIPAGVCCRTIFFVIPSKVRGVKSRELQLVFEISPLLPPSTRGTSVEMTRRCCSTPTQAGIHNKHYTMGNR